MKRLLGLFLLAGAVVACSKSDDLPTNDIPAGMGTVAFAVTNRNHNTSRGQSRRPRRYAPYCQRYGAHHHSARGWI